MRAGARAGDSPALRAAAEALRAAAGIAPAASSPHGAGEEAAAGERARRLAASNSWTWDLTGRAGPAPTRPGRAVPGPRYAPACLRHRHVIPDGPGSRRESPRDIAVSALGGASDHSANVPHSLGELVHHGLPLPGRPDHRHDHHEREGERQKGQRHYSSNPGDHRAEGTHPSARRPASLMTRTSCQRDLVLDGGSLFQQGAVVMSDGVYPYSHRPGTHRTLIPRQDEHLALGT